MHYICIRWIPGPGFATPFSYATWRVLSSAYNSSQSSPVIYDTGLSPGVFGINPKGDSFLDGLGLGSAFNYGSTAAQTHITASRLGVSGGVIAAFIDGYNPILFSRKVAVLRAVYLFVFPYYPMVGE
jgi:hypothetical protein